MVDTYKHYFCDRYFHKNGQRFHELLVPEEGLIIRRYDEGDGKVIFASANGYLSGKIEEFKVNPVNTLRWSDDDGMHELYRLDNEKTVKFMDTLNKFKTDLESLIVG